MPDRNGTHATLACNGASYDLPVVTGTQDETAVDITALMHTNASARIDRSRQIYTTSPIRHYVPLKERG